MAEPRRGIPGVALVGSVLVLAVVVNAVVTGGLPWTTTPTVVSPLPVTLTAVPLTGTTVTASTVATTTGFVPGLVGASTLTVARQSPNDWNLKLAVTSATGITGGETLVLAIVSGTTQTISLSSSTTFPQVTSAVTLNAAAFAVTAATLNLVSGCHACSATVELRITPAGGASLPSFVYPYTITTAA